MKLDEVTRNYDRASRYYDWLTDVVGGPLRLEKCRARTIDLLGDLDGATVLDVGCGTGRSFPILVSRVGPRGRIIGLDYSEGMLEKARARVRQQGWLNVEIVRGDAATLEGVEELVDAVISVWCMGIVHDIDAALHRAVDLLRPSGRMAIMDFDRARSDKGPFYWLYPVYSSVLRWVGVDSAEDLDDARLRAKWDRGRAILRERLDDLFEERCLSVTRGEFVIAGTARGM